MLILRYKLGCLEAGVLCDKLSAGGGAGLESWRPPPDGGHPWGEGGNCGGPALHRLHPHHPGRQRLIHRGVHMHCHQQVTSLFWARLKIFKLTNFILVLEATAEQLWCLGKRTRWPSWTRAETPRRRTSSHWTGWWPAGLQSPAGCSGSGWLAQVELNIHCKLS